MSAVSLGSSGQAIAESPPHTPAERARGVRVLAFCVFYAALQVTLIVRGLGASSKHFAFWMFSESTFFVARLGRELPGGRLVDAPGGRWEVGRPDGGRVVIDWAQHVQAYNLGRLETPTKSKGTWLDTRRYFQEALDYVAERIPEDTETDRLILTLQSQKAGGPVETTVLRSRLRFGGAARVAP